MDIEKPRLRIKTKEFKDAVLNAKEECLRSLEEMTYDDISAKKLQLYFLAGKNQEELTNCLQTFVDAEQQMARDIRNYSTVINNYLEQI